VLANDSFTHNLVYLRDLFKSLVLCVQKEQTGSVIQQLSTYVEYTDGTIATGNGPLTMTEVFTGVTMATVHSL